MRQELHGKQVLDVSMVEICMKQMINNLLQVALSQIRNFALLQKSNEMYFETGFETAKGWTTNRGFSAKLRVGVCRPRFQNRTVG